MNPLPPPSLSEQKRMYAQQDGQGHKTARSCYIAANLLVLGAMAFACLPNLGFSSWLVAAPLCLTIVILAIVMFVHGAVSNGLVSLLFALVVVPAWVYFAPSFVPGMMKRIQASTQPSDAAGTVGASGQQVEESLDNRDRQQRMLLAELAGKTFLEIEGLHGPVHARDKLTGWATWPTFKARFSNGKVSEIELR